MVPGYGNEDDRLENEEEQIIINNPLLA